MPEKFLLFENFSIKWNEILEELAQSAGGPGRQPPEADEFPRTENIFQVGSQTKIELE